MGFSLISRFDKHNFSTGTAILLTIREERYDMIVRTVRITMGYEKEYMKLWKR